MMKCHTGFRMNLRRQCDAYCTGSSEELAASGEYPELEDGCNSITWREANQDNNWGNCMEMTVDEEFRFITSNTVPDYYMNPYCPIGLGYGYCVPQEVTCFFPVGRTMARAQQSTEISGYHSLHISRFH